MKSGIELIAEERQRQIEKEGWTSAHDAGHTGGELLEAAECYIVSAIACGFSNKCVTYDGGYRPNEGTPTDWPWEKEWWKPSGDPIRDLQKAGALIAAEIDRINHSK